jgi:biopolymer transport protein ExbD
MSVQIKRSSAAGTLSMTPLIDVVFLLLIFFLVTSRFDEEERRLPIELPVATSATPMTQKPREVVVDIDREGNLYTGGEATTPAELEAILRRAVASNPTNQTVIIRADAGTRFQPVVSVMDLCNRVGVAEYLTTTKEGPDG